MSTKVTFGTRVEAHPHRPRVLKFREGGDDRTISVRALPGGHVTYASLLVLKDASFDVQPAGPTRVREVTGVRDVHAFVRGEVMVAMYDLDDHKHFDPSYISAPWVLVSYNPFKADHFYEVLANEDGSHEAGRQVLSADSVVMRGGDCYAINPVFAVETCEAETERGMCHRPIVERGYCDRPSDHV